jgi:hypothetical protein
MPDKFKYKVIEIDRSFSGQGWEKADEDSIAQLRGNPGFDALMRKWKLQSALVEGALKSQRHESLADIARLQGWLDCFGFIERFVRRDIEKKKEKRPREAFDIEREQFEQIQNFVSIVGKAPNES